MQFDIICTMTKNYGIGVDRSNLPCGLDRTVESSRYFARQVPPKSAVIMGKKTWDNMLKHNPMHSYVNIVISSANSGVTIEGALTSNPVVHVNSLIAALNYCGQIKPPACFVIGGEATFAEALKSAFLRYAYLTVMDIDCDCDVHFPARILEAGLPIKKKKLTYNQYYRVDFTNRDELAYHKLCSELLAAPVRPNRTTISARGLFHEVLKFNLHCPIRGNILPLITSKRTPINCVLGELLWFISAGTTTEQLHKNNIHIWDGNSTSGYLAGRGLNYKPGELGPIYGWQWRHYGETWPTSEPRGIDQLANVIETIKTDPYNRRLLVSAWNVTDLHKMALPPCHYSFQFHVEEKSGAPAILNCLVNMRSADIALGVPFNIASYALLTHMVAQVTKLTPGVLSLSMADCHLYVNHIEGIQTMLKRIPRRFPTIRFSDRIHADMTIDDFMAEDIIIGEYQSHPRIKLDMAV